MMQWRGRRDLFPLLLTWLAEVNNFLSTIVSFSLVIPKFKTIMAALKHAYISAALPLLGQMFLKHVCASCTRRRERTAGPWLQSLLCHELWRKRGFPCVCAWNGIVHSLCHISACLTRQNKSFSIFQSTGGLTERGSRAVLPRLCFLLSRPFLSVVPSVLSPPVLWSAPLSS